ncbi:MAG: LamG-like jellyroll fold domain-containing protein [Bacteroidota bacterium]
MLLAKQHIQYINSITHDGKLILLATDKAGKLWYTIKQDGFEDSYLEQAPGDRIGWEDWQALILPDEAADPSVEVQEGQEYRSQQEDWYGVKEGDYLMRSRYEKSAALTHPTAVQLVSGIGHLYIFRQSNSQTLLMDRFVFDGLTNKLNPKLEVRFRASGQKYKAQHLTGTTGLKQADVMDFRDPEGQPFFEPTTELGLIRDLVDGRFSVVLLPTEEKDRYYWHVFAYNGKESRVEITSIRSDLHGRFDLKDLDNRPGVIRYAIQLQDSDGNALKVTNGLVASKYDLQREESRRHDTHLLKVATRVLLVVPTNQGAATLDFAVKKDGTLSQVKLKGFHQQAEATQLFNVPKELMLPDNTLDEVKGAISAPTLPQGKIEGMEWINTERFRIHTDNTEGAKFGYEVDIFADPEGINGAYSQVSTIMLGTVKTLSSDALTLTPPTEGLPISIAKGDRLRLEKQGKQPLLLIVNSPVEAKTSGDIQLSLETIEGESSQSLNAYQTASVIHAGIFDLTTPKDLGSWRLKKRIPPVFDGKITAVETQGDDGLRVHTHFHTLQTGNHIRIANGSAYLGASRVLGEDNKHITLQRFWQPGEVINLDDLNKNRRGLTLDGNGDYVQVDGIEVDLPRQDERFAQTVMGWIKWTKPALQTDPQSILDTGSMKVSILNGGKLSITSQLLELTESKDFHTYKLSIAGFSSLVEKLRSQSNSSIQDIVLSDEILLISYKAGSTHGSSILQYQKDAEGVWQALPDLNLRIDGFSTIETNCISLNESGTELAVVSIFDTPSNKNKHATLRLFSINRDGSIADQTFLHTWEVDRSKVNSGFPQGYKQICFYKDFVFVPVAKNSISFFHRKNGSWSLEETIPNHPNIGGIAADDDYLYVGDPYNYQAESNSHYSASHTDPTSYHEAGGVVRYKFNPQGTPMWQREDTPLILTNPIPDIHFGHTLALHKNKLAVGAPGHDPLKENSRVYLYLKDEQAPSGWKFVQELQAPDKYYTENKYGFGSSLCFRPDGTLYIRRSIREVHAFAEDHSKSFSYTDEETLPANQWVHITASMVYDPTTKSTTAELLKDGQVVEIAGNKLLTGKNEISLFSLPSDDFQGKNLHIPTIEGLTPSIAFWQDSHMVIGLPSGNLSTHEASLLIYQRNSLSDSWTGDPTSNPNNRAFQKIGGSSTGYYGSAVVWGPKQEVLVGDPKASTTEGGKGKVFIHKLQSDGNWEVEPQSFISPPYGASNSSAFGAALQQADNRLFIGDPGDNKVYIYQLGNDHWQHHRTISAPRGHKRFGASLAYARGLLVIGDPGYKDPQEDAGAVFIYKEQTEGWTQVGAPLLSADHYSSSNFGKSLLLRANLLAIGVNSPLGHIHFYQLSTDGSKRRKIEGGFESLQNNQSGFGKMLGYDPQGLLFTADDSGIQLCAHFISNHTGSQDVANVLQATPPNVYPHAIPKLNLQSSHDNDLTSSLTIGKGYGGKISEVQLWSKKIDASEIAKRKYLRLTGREIDLMGYWRLSGIAHEGLEKSVFDFSIYGNHGIVHGDPFISEKSLARMVGAEDATEYLNAELFAVTEANLYTESFEFKITMGGKHLPNIDPNNYDHAQSDHTDPHLFKFYYWGKKDRVTHDKITEGFNPVQASFAEIPGEPDWYRATCTFEVPQGCKLIRLFHIRYVKGDAWDQLHVRKHKITRNSNSITGNFALDQVKLHSLGAEVDDTEFQTLIMQEQQEMSLLRKIEELNGLTNRIASLATLKAIISNLDGSNGEIQQARIALNKELINPSNYEVMILRRNDDSSFDALTLHASSEYSHIALEKTLGGPGYSAQLSDYISLDRLKKILKPIDATSATFEYDFLSRQQAKEELKNAAFSSSTSWTKEGQTDNYKYQAYSTIWEIELDNLGSDQDIKTTQISASGKTLDILVYNSHFGFEAGPRGDWPYGYYKVYMDKVNYMLAFHDPGKNLGMFQSHLWLIVPTKIQTPAGSRRIDTARERFEEKKRIRRKVANMIAKIEADTNKTGALDITGQIAALKTRLQSARTSLATTSNSVLTAIKQQDHATEKMHVYKPAEKDLLTSGALLNFVQTQSGFSALESGEGNIHLSYLDDKGRMRKTQYDTVSDHQNAYVQQWLIDGARRCQNLNTRNSVITFDQDKEKSPFLGKEWTVETWFEFPLAVDTKSWKSRTWNTLLSSDEGRLIAIRNGKWLGVEIDGYFHSIEFDLLKKLTPGWHHLAISSQAIVGIKKEEQKVERKGLSAQELTCYLDGKPIGKINNSPEALLLDGQGRAETDQAYHFFQEDNSVSKEFTVSAWVKWSSIQGSAPILTLKHDEAIYCSLGAKAENGQAYLTLNLGTNTEITSFVPFATTANEWHYVSYSVLYSANTYFVFAYLDGQILPLKDLLSSREKPMLEFGEAALSFPNAPLKAVLGGDGTGSSGWKGEMAQVVLWKKYRHQSLVETDMFRAFTGEEFDLVGHWTFGGELVLDRSPSKANAQYHGTFAGRDKANLKSYSLHLQHPIHAIGNNISQTNNVRNEAFGKLAELRIWNTALNKEEIEVNSKTTLTGNEPGLLAYYSFDGNIKDVTGRGRNGTSSSGVDWVCSAPIGRLGHHAMKFDGHSTYLKAEHIQFIPKDVLSFSLWVKADLFSPYTSIIRKWGEQAGLFDVYLNADNHLELKVFIYNQPSIKITDPEILQRTEWIHLAVVIDSTMCSFFKNGKLLESTKAKQPYDVSTFHDNMPFSIGAKLKDRGELAHDPNYWQGQICQVRMWDRPLSKDDILEDMAQTISPNELGLVAHWPLDNFQGGVSLDKDNQSWQVSSHQECSNLVDPDYPLVIGGTPKIAAANPANAVVINEYSTMRMTTFADGQERLVPMLRRSFAIPSLGGVELLSDQRIEELEKVWIGNAQFNPTLLGYIEGAPPVPSENLTFAADYNGASSIKLSQSEKTKYSWNRSQDGSLGFTLDASIGLHQENRVGIGVGVSIEQNLLGILAKAKANVGFSYHWLNSSTVSTTSIEAFNDSLALRGGKESFARIPQLGKRFIPKNVGYALVISSMADVYILRLKRSKRMISYQVTPVPNMPPDINTITFMMNPAYTKNGTLDGLNGTSAADDHFYKHVPGMRAEYGSLYPASYFRLAEAYKLKTQIDRIDKERESYFVNFNSLLVDETSLNSEIGAEQGGYGDFQGIDVSDDTTDNGSITPLTPEEKLAQQEEQEKKSKEKGDQLTDDVESLEEDMEKQQEEKEEEINNKIEDLDKRVHAAEAFAGWQKKMENLLIRAGKRNIVNTYVWDADGGLRSEQQQFANTVEHSIGGSINLSGSIGVGFQMRIGPLALAMTPLATFGLVQTMNKSNAVSEGFSLSVDLGGVEHRGVTDHNDYPILPGEKVDRYRFMSFYLDGDTQHFKDFFSKVVDPEWLASNDEEALALRQISQDKPNKTWRVLHRVTYVERPSLMGFSSDTRKLVETELQTDSQQIIERLEKLNSDQVWLRRLADEIKKQIK